MDPTADGPSLPIPSTVNASAAIHTAWTDTPQGPRRRNTGTASKVKPASQSRARTAQPTPTRSARPAPATNTLPAVTTAAATSSRRVGLRPSNSGPSTLISTGAQATATAITAGSACDTPRTTATLNSTNPVTATPQSHSHSRPRGRTMRTPAQ